MPTLQGNQESKDKKLCTNSRTSLHFPSPAVIDTEKGTAHYGKFFDDFYRLETNDVDKVHEALDELLENPGPFKTFVIDSMSDIYDSILKKREDFMKKKSGNARYELIPKDYQFIKRDVKLLISKILALDMNIVATARSKPLYAEDEFMKQIGTTAEGHKDIPYRFDVVLELTVAADGTRWAKVEKDRTNTLPHRFEFDYKTFSKYINIEGLEREAVAFTQKQALQTLSPRKHEIDLHGTKLMTAGVEAETLMTLQIITEELDPSTVKATIRDLFSVESMLDLTDNEAKSLISELKSDV